MNQFEPTLFGKNWLFLQPITKKIGSQWTVFKNYCLSLQPLPIAVGSYPVVVGKGTIENAFVNLVNGALTVTHAPLTIRVGNYTIKQGDPLPDFTLTYEGFKNGESAAVLTAQPVVACEATSASALGDYLITVSSGEAQNYTFDYINGTLTVTESSGIVELLTDEKECRVYTISGRRILKPQCGVNIIVTSDGSRVKVIRK